MQFLSIRACQSCKWAWCAVPLAKSHWPAGLFKPGRREYYTELSVGPISSTQPNPTRGLTQPMDNSSQFLSVQLVVGEDSSAMFLF